MSKLSEKERRFLQYLADLFNNNGYFTTTRIQVCDDLDLAGPEFERLVRLADSLHVVDRVESRNSVYASDFGVTYNSALLCSELDAIERFNDSPDFVEQIHSRMKRNPTTAAVVIVLLVIGYVAQVYPMVVDFMAWLRSARE